MSGADAGQAGVGVVAQNQLENGAAHFHQFGVGSDHFHSFGDRGAAGTHDAAVDFDDTNAASGSGVDVGVFA